uniref:Adipokinetic hormone receptor isoform X2 n=2 Tax=Carausius morosus TaxID=7022 RepID=A0A891XI04_CARMO|nr:adipokinetic hormone receptor isoform X2 [Carausius morosus]
MSTRAAGSLLDTVVNVSCSDEGLLEAAVDLTATSAWYVERVLEAAVNVTCRHCYITEDMVFNKVHILSMVAFSIMMVVSSIGNITVVNTLLRRNKRSRINLMLVHLAVGDLVVTFMTMPMEIAWNYTVWWRGGSTFCHIMSFFRVFGFYLSSSVLICISIDRYFAVLRPMSLKGQNARHMLATAWVVSVLSSLPQVVVFHLESPKGVPDFIQCVAFNTFSREGELAYNFFNMFMTYGIPLMVIVFCYVSIIMEICRCSKENNDTIRRSSQGYLGRAKARTLKMTITIVLAFIVCWTPYYIMCVWYWLDTVSAKNVNPVVQKALFLFASTNSCMNPIVYGMFNLRNCGFGRDTQQSSRMSPPRIPDRNRPARIIEWKRKTKAMHRGILLDLMLVRRATDTPTAR